MVYTWSPALVLKETRERSGAFHGPSVKRRTWGTPSLCSRMRCDAVEKPSPAFLRLDRVSNIIRGEVVG